MPQVSEDCVENGVRFEGENRVTRARVGLEGGVLSMAYVGDEAFRALGIVDGVGVAVLQQQRDVRRVARRVDAVVETLAALEEVVDLAQ